jgi:pilus assembly protein Flp/PilA
MQSLPSWTTVNDAYDQGRGRSLGHDHAHDRGYDSTPEEPARPLEGCQPPLEELEMVEDGWARAPTGILRRNRKRAMHFHEMHRSAFPVSQQACAYPVRIEHVLREGGMRNIYGMVLSTYSWLKADSEKGVTALEYGLLAAMIAVGIATAVGTLGGNLTDVFNSVATNIHT